ncbi:MAG TPA: type IX secretion system membrane protein PorP/SprF [Bacteroidia bacterium]|nr:type IX secretion system membrane protein PorP/SprF [Bacteroidia bacterium]
MKKLFVFLLAAVTASNLYAQQNPHYSQYMFNGLAINPAYAGSKDYLSTCALYRMQWMDFPGAPKTATFSIHGPISAGKMGLGFTFISDKIGPTSRMDFNAAYAFHIETGSGVFALGIQGGGTQYSAKLSDLHTFDLNDDVQANGDKSEFRPNAGAGLYYYTEKFYAGLSVPELLKDDPKSTSDIKTGPSNAMHYFFTTGIVLGSSDNFKLKPSVMVKYARNAPVNYDINANFFFGKVLGVGVSYRSEDALVGLLSLQLTPQLRFGYSYDMIQTDIKEFGPASHEFMLGYDFGHEVPKVRVPRYF